MSVPVSGRSSGCRSSRERVAMLASGLMCIDFFVAGDDLTSPFPLSLKQTDPGAAGFFWRSAFSSYLRWRRVSIWEAVTPRDPSWLSPTQARMYKLVHSVETPRDITIRFVD